MNVGARKYTLLDRDKAQYRWLEYGDTPTSKGTTL